MVQSGGSEDDDSDVRVLEQDGKPSADDSGDCVIVDPPPPSPWAGPLRLQTTQISEKPTLRHF